MEVTIRPTTAADVDDVGQILYDAFNTIADLHNFPRDFPTLEIARLTAKQRIAHPRFYGIVAESAGAIVGSNFLDERGEVRAIGPISVDPSLHERGFGRQLMLAVIRRAYGSHSVRLVQDAFNTLSMPLYASLGFEVKEPLVLIEGRLRADPPAEGAVRPLTNDDAYECSRLHEAVHGVERLEEIRDAIRHFSPYAIVQRGKITGYVTSITNWGLAHGVAETEDDLRGLLAGVSRQSRDRLSFLLPTRQAALFRWCLAGGLRVVKPMTLMSMGHYREPRGAWFPSVLY
jgi:predicted N-acetyltransferase YhbS